MRDAVFDLSGKVAVVTGAGAGGLGHSAALALARAGASIAAIDLPEQHESVASTVRDVQELGGDAMALLADVSDEESIHSAFDHLRQSWTSPDVVLNNAGVMLRKASLEMTATEWRRVIDINLTGTWLVSCRAAQDMKDRGRGRIINMSSQYAVQVGPFPEAAYYASKAGIANLTRALAAEWAQHGINVNCIAPGVFYPTAMTDTIGQDLDALHSLEQRTLLKRLGDPSRDLDGAVVFLSADASSYITGSILYVDGGWTAW